MKKTTITCVSIRNRFAVKFIALLLVFVGVSVGEGWGQIYVHDFGSSAITTKPYSGAPTTFATNLSSSSWTTSASAFGGFGINGSGALSLANSSGTPTFTLTFNVAAGYQLSVTSFNFSRIRSATGAQNWSMTINGVNVGSGTIPTTAAAIGQTNVTNTISGLTGTLTIVYTMSGASGTGTARMDDFTLNGSVTATSSSFSDIIANTSFTYPTNIAYNSYQGAAPLTTGNSIEVGQFDIRDGGASSDADALSTTLTALTLNVANPGSLRRIALFDGSTNVGEVAAGATATFTGLTLAAADGGSKTFSVRASFLSSVADNQQFSFTVSSTTASGAGSGFAAANAGGAVTSTTGDANRIEVTASDLSFGVNPSTVSINGVMSPSPTVVAKDANANMDLDFTGSVTLSSTGTIAVGTTNPVNAVSGTATFSNLLFSVSGTGLTVAGSASGVNPTGNSVAFDVTNPQPEINVKQASTSIATAGTYDFGNQISGSSSSVITFTVENLGTADLNLSGSPKVVLSGTNADEFTIDQTTTSATVSASSTTTFTITFSPTSQGSKTASISIANNDATGSENPYIVILTGTGTVSAASDIANTSGYTYTSNVAYASYQTASTLTVGNSVGATGITLSDGAGSSDADNLGTTLSAISFTTGGSSAIRTAALFDGSTNVSEVAVNGGTTISFAGLSLTAADNTTKDLELRVTYMSTVTDNQQITFTVSAATASTAGSTFAAANAGGVASTATSDVNRIEVIATQLAFVQQPSNAVIGGNMSPAVNVKAIDTNSITDLDFAGNIDITSTGTLSSSPQTSAALAGVATFSTVNHSAIGTGLKLTAASSGLTSVESGTFDISVQPAGILLFEDNFNYTGLLTANGYTNSSGISNYLTAGTTGLTFSNYGSSAIGNALAVANTGEDVYKLFTQQNSPTTVYASFLVNISEAKTGDYVFAYAPSSGTATYRARFFIKTSSNAGFVNFGIANINSGTVYGTTDFALNSTHLVVVKYQFTSATTATATVFVNPNVNSEPATNEISLTDNVGANAPADITSFTIRQGSATSAPTFVMDGLRIATNWGSLMGNASYDSNANIAAGNYNSINVMTGSTLTQTGNVVASGLTIESGSSLTVNAGKQLTVSNTMTNNGTLNLLSDATGTATILTPATISGSGSTSVQQYLGTTRNWYVSSPLSNAKAPTGFTYYQRNEAGPSWTSVSAGDNFVPGVGYIALPNASGALTFSTETGGNLNTGNVTVPLTYTSTVTKKGFNLIGNPFACHLTWTKDFTDANVSLIEPSIYYRTNSGSSNTGGWTNPTYNAFSGESALSGSAIIPPMQAFWVRAVASGDLIINSNLTRSHQASNPLKAPSAKSAERKRLRLLVDNGVAIDEALIYFDSSASNSYDTYDSPKMINGSTSTNPDIFTLIGAEQLVINGMNSIPYNVEIPLYFNANASTANSFTLKANEFSNFEVGTSAYIKNNLTGEQQLISDGSAYSFDATTVINNPAFSLIIKAPGSITSINNTNSGNNTIFVNSNRQLLFTIPSFTENTMLSVFNSIGQKIYCCRVSNSSTLIENSLSPGVYIVNINTTTTKVIVK